MNFRGAIAVGILSLSGAFLASTAASANVILNYTGNDFTTVSGPYSTADAVTGTLTFSGPLADNLTLVSTITPPLSFSFTDGVQTITNSSVGSMGPYFHFQTDSSGNITAWSVTVIAANDSSEIFTSNYPAVVADEGNLYSGEALVGFGRDSNPGTFSVVGVPEPITLSLFATGLAGAVAMRRRKKAKA